MTTIVHTKEDGSVGYGSFASCSQTSKIHRLPDWSYAGYAAAARKIPRHEGKTIELEPEDAKDDRERIQRAIDAISKNEPNKDGHRGTVVLEKGTFRVEGSLRIDADGVVVRGVGMATRIVATMREQHSLFVVGGSHNGKFRTGKNPVARIRSVVVPIGSYRVEVDRAKIFEVGSRVLIRRTPNDAWIDALKMRDFGWKAEAYVIENVRTIVGIALSDDDTSGILELDEPMFDAFESRFGGGSVVALTSDQGIRARECGIESMLLVSEYAAENDEKHGWEAIRLQSVENCWVKNITAQYFGYACVRVRGISSHVTVEDCAHLDPKSQITGGRRYCFCVDDRSRRILFQRCYTRRGRHSFVTGAKVPGPVVWLDCLAERTENDDGPHHRWASGLLYDCCATGKLHVQNRCHSGSGHGWSGTTVCFWNCRASKQIIVDAPPHGMNFAVNCTGKMCKGGWSKTETRGIVAKFESLDIESEKRFRSLYLMQLSERLGPGAINAVTTAAQRSGTIWSDLRAWSGGGTASSDVATKSSEGTVRPPRPPASAVPGADVTIDPRKNHGDPCMHDVVVQNNTGVPWTERVFVKLELDKPSSCVKGWGANKSFKMCSKDGRVWQFWFVRALGIGQKASAGIRIAGGAKPARVYIKKCI